MATRDGARRVFIALILLALGLVFTIALPFAGGFVFAAVLAATLYPVHRRLTAKLGGRSNLSASLLCAGSLLLLLMPLGGLGAFVVGEIIRGTNFVIQTIQSEGMNALVDGLPTSLQGGARHGIKLLIPNPEHLDEELRRRAGQHGGQVARFVSRTLAAAGKVLLQSSLSLVALFFFLVDGRKFVGWIEENSPLVPGQVHELLVEFRKVSSAVLISTLVTAGVQSLVALVGYLIARVPHPFFFAIVTFFISFIPAIGAGGTCLAAALLLLASGKVWSALFLALWIMPVGLVDNWVKPLLVKRGMHMHGGVVFFALLGGIAAFGAVGLLLGPLFVTFLVALVRIYRRDFSDSQPSPTEQEGAEPHSPSA